VSLLLYMDHHVPGPVTHGLRKRGVQVLTAFEDGRANAPDNELLARAMELGRIVFTQDDDFLVLADQWNKEGRHFAGIVYAHQLRVTIGQIIADLRLIVEAVTADEIRDIVLFLPI